MTRLAPLIDPVVAALIADTEALGDLAERYGSPLNVVFPQVFTANVAAFRELLNSYRLRHRIFYAHKANQSRSLIRAAAQAGIGVDIASAGELAGARAGGVPPGRIEATGPKGEAMLRSALAHEGLVVNVDNLWELGKLAELAHRPVPVLLRMTGGRRTSRFGISPEQFTTAYEVIRARPDALDLLGVSFHLDTAEVAEKTAAVRTALELIEAAHLHGLAPRVLNIGGGYRQAYLADPAEFDAYVLELRQGLLGHGPALGWGGYTFGYHHDRTGTLRGTPVFHRYANAVPGVRFLQELLNTPLTGTHSIARVLQESLLELWIEPGKALADHAGITVATVQFTKQAADGGILVNLDLSRDDVTPSDQEVMLDPVLAYRGAAGDYDDTPCGVYLAGNLCLERDMISNHQVRLPRLPLPGDLVVFVNTAAYQMDLSASQALMHPRLPKVSALLRSGRFTVTPDGEDACSTTTSPT
jgi:diaminopimelate decarboxylase